MAGDIGEASTTVLTAAVHTALDDMGSTNELTVLTAAVQLPNPDVGVQQRIRRYLEDAISAARGLHPGTSVHTQIEVAVRHALQ